ncbi:PDZ domain-containing protein [Sediminibacterium ginsengisoli]|uniref:PDZ domain-containing protein n=1 Tax=Sediminibacterium ginsengisoli TaxID=413434 RepID=UPI001C37D257|nr:PDZ domain-containing protein [Sediminibacterium ginsengisoli]
MSVSGNDANEGTKEKPFATPEQAKLKARTIRGKLTVYLRGGTYYLQKPLVFTPADSRKDNEPLVFTAYHDEQVVFSGARQLQLKWEKNNGTTWRASIPEDLTWDRLFINGKLQQMARYPNYNPAAKIFKGTAPDAISPERIKKWNHPEGAYVHALHRSEWGDFHYRVLGKDDTGALKMEGGWQNNRKMGMHKDFRFVENVREELDTAGEWYADKNKGLLLYYPATPTSLSRAVIEVPQLAHLAEFRGTAADPVRNISLEGLSFTQTTRTFMQTNEPLLRSDWAVYRGAAVFFTGTEHCSVRGASFYDLGGNGVFFSNYNRNDDVSGCSFINIGASAVCFAGDPAAVRSPLYEYHESLPLEKIDRTPGPIGVNYPAACTVYDNLIHDIGLEEKQVAGVQISMSQDILVKHNTIYNVPRAGININDGTWGGHVIEYNDVFNTVLETGDHGAFNSWGRDRFWHPVRDSMNARTDKLRDELVLLDAVHTNIIRYNRFRCDHGWDIDLDDGSTNYEIYNNVLLNGGLKLREGFFRKAENNIILNNSFHPHVWFRNSEDVFVKNVIATSYKPVRINVWGKQVDKNVFLDSLSLIKEQQAGHDQHSVYAAPAFMDASKGDYRLKPGSAAFSTGFQNFPMDNFGVISPPLKARAMEPPLPELLLFNEQNDQALSEFMGLKVKNLNTLAERSATGMHAETGVLVKEVDASSPLRAYIRPNDVILEFNETATPDLRALREAKIGKRLRNTFTIKLFRDQQEQLIQITIR